MFLLQLSRQENRAEDTTQAVMPSNKYSSAIMAESDKMTATVISNTCKHTHTLL